MSKHIHHLYDKRQKKPVVFRAKKDNEDITIQEIINMRLGKCKLRFDAPNFTSLFLSKSKFELKKAREIYDSLIRPKINTRKSYELSKEDNVILFDYLEHIQSAIVMAYTAVECLANDLLPDDFSYIDEERGRTPKQYDRKEIERWIPTIEKVAVVLPKALGKINPKKYSFWPKFTKLKDLRNDIIHFRSLMPIEQKEAERIISLLLQDSVFGKIESAYDLIGKIHSDLSPHSKMPILNNTEDINPIEIDTWDSLGYKQTN